MYTQYNLHIYHEYASLKKTKLDNWMQLRRIPPDAAANEPRDAHQAVCHGAN
jgi:hypothetical protein